MGAWMAELCMGSKLLCDATVGMFCFVASVCCARRVNMAVQMYVFAAEGAEVL